MASRSGRSSRSTLMLTNPAFMTDAVLGSSNDSRSMMWHQWQAEYPIDSRIGLSSALARVSASDPHGYQSTGLSACCSRYGLVSSARRLAMLGMVGGRAPPRPNGPARAAGGFLHPG